MDLTKGPIRKTIFRFSIPLILTLVITQAYSIADTVIVSTLCAPNDLSCISSASIVFNVPCNLLSGMAVGFGILVSRARGAGDREGCRSAVLTGLAFLAGAALAAGAVLILAPVPLLRLTRVPEVILSRAADVLRLYGLQLLLYGGILSMTGSLENLGHSRPPLWISVSCGALNIALDLAAVSALGLGLFGTVWASILCQSLQLAALSVCLVRRCRPLGRAGRPRLSLVRAAFSYSAASTLQYALSSLDLTVLQTVVNSNGVSYINGLSAALLTFSVFNNAVNGYGQGYQVFLSQNLGAGRTDRVRQAVRQSGGDTLLVGGAISVLLLLSARPITLFLIGGKGAEAVSFALWASLLRIPQYFIGMYLQLKSAFLRVAGFNRELLAAAVLHALVYTAAVLVLGRVFLKGVSLADAFAALAKLLILLRAERRGR